MKDFKTAADTNVFGENEHLSYDFVANHIGQLRNSVITSRAIDASLLSSIQSILPTITTNKSFDVLINDVMNAYGASLKDIFLGYYIRMMRSRTTRLANLFLKKGQLNGKTVPVQLVKNIFATHKIHTIKEFKKVSKTLISKELLAKDPNYGQITNATLKEQVILKIEGFLQELINRKDRYVAGAIFKPTFPRVKIVSFDTTGLIEYIATNLFYEIKNQIYTIFLNPKDIQKLQESITTITGSLYNNSLPQIKKLSIPLVQPEYMYEFDGSTLRAKFGMVKGQGKAHELILNPNNRVRFNRLYNPMYTTTSKGAVKDNLGNPVLKLEGRKLLLCQPFYTKTAVSAPPSSTAPRKVVELGVDLGIKDFATISVMEKTDPLKLVEMCRYFIDQRTLYDMHFNPDTGKFEFITSPYDKKKRPTNMKLKLIHLEQERRNMQRLCSDYESRHPADFKKKIKWYHLMKTKTSIWNKIQKIHQDMIHRIGNLIVQIAHYHSIDRIRFEDLRWSQHQPKKKKGKFIAFWQTHWFHSQIQEFTSQLAARKGIETVIVDAFMTSKTCAQCTKEGIRHKDNSKLFICPHCKKTLDADLNAARNIAKRDTVKVLPVAFSEEYLCSPEGLQ